MNKFIKPLIILVVLVALWLVVRYTSENPSRPNPEVSLNLKISPEEINRMEIFARSGEAYPAQGNKQLAGSNPCRSEACGKRTG